MNVTGQADFARIDIKGNALQHFQLAESLVKVLDDQCWCGVSHAFSPVPGYARSGSAAFPVDISFGRFAGPGK